MATVINEMMIEPKAMPPGEPAAAKSASPDSPVSPDVQREIAKMMHKAKQRAARLFAH